MSRIGQPTVFAQFPTKTFTGNGTKYQWTLDYAPGVKGAIDVLIGNTPQHASQYDIDNLTLTTGVVPNGVEVEVRYKGVLALVQVPVDASVSTAKVVDQAITKPKLSSDVQALLGAGGSFKNLLIGGDFTTNPWQRGTSFTPAASTLTYTADRWCVYRGATGFLIGKAAITGAPAPIAAACRVQRSPGDTSKATINLSQSVESINCAPSAGQTVTLSFWAQSGADLSSFVNVSVQSGTGTDQNALTGLTGAVYFISQNVSIGTTWTKYTYSASVPSNSTQLAINFSYTPTGTAGANDWYQIANVQLEVSSSATAFEYLPEDVVLQRCLRYYETGTAMGWGYWGGTTGIAVSSHIVFHSRKRVTPTIVATNTSVSNCGTRATISALTVDGFNDAHLSTTAAGCQWVDTWTASAEL